MKSLKESDGMRWKSTTERQEKEDETKSARKMMRREVGIEGWLKR